MLREIFLPRNRHQVDLVAHQAAARIERFVFSISLHLPNFGSDRRSKLSIVGNTQIKPCRDFSRFCRERDILCFDIMRDLNTINLLKTVTIGSHKIALPTLWLGHDLKSSVKVWKRIPQCPGIMLSAHQIIEKRAFLQEATRLGLAATLDFNGPVFLDSGGFVFQKQGICTVRVRDLLSLYRQLRPDIAAVLDFPLSPLVSQQHNARRWQRTLLNTALMSKECPNLPIVPVVHSYDHRDLDRRYCELEKIISNPTFLCLGSLVPLLKASHIGARFSNTLQPQPPTLRRWNLITALVVKIRMLYPNAILHVFGVGSVSTMLMLFLLGVNSVDSVAWRLKAAYGEIQLPGLSNRSLERNRFRTRARRVLTKAERELLGECCCPVCDHIPSRRRVETLRRSYSNRAVHNAFVMVSELLAFQKALFGDYAMDHVEHSLSTNKLYSGILRSVIIPAISRSTTA